MGNAINLGGLGGDTIDGKKFFHKKITPTSDSYYGITLTHNLGSVSQTIAWIDNYTPTEESGGSYTKMVVSQHWTLKSNGNWFGAVLNQAPWNIIPATNFNMSPDVIDNNTLRLNNDSLYPWKANIEYHILIIE